MPGELIFPSGLRSHRSPKSKSRQQKPGPPGLRPFQGPAASFLGAGKTVADNDKGAPLLQGDAFLRGCLAKKGGQAQPVMISDLKFLPGLFHSEIPLPCTDLQQHQAQLRPDFLPGVHEDKRNNSLDHHQAAQVGHGHFKRLLVISYGQHGKGGKASRGCGQKAGSKTPLKNS